MFSYLSFQVRTCYGLWSSFKYSQVNRHQMTPKYLSFNQQIFWWWKSDLPTIEGFFCKYSTMNSKLQSCQWVSNSMIACHSKVQVYIYKYIYLIDLHIVVVAEPIKISIKVKYFHIFIEMREYAIAEWNEMNGKRAFNHNFTTWNENWNQYVPIGTTPRDSYQCSGTVLCKFRSIEIYRDDVALGACSSHQIVLFSVSSLLMLTFSVTGYIAVVAITHAFGKVSAHNLDF